MYLIKRLFASAVLVIYIASCTNHESTTTNTANELDTVIINGHPAWILQGNIYEVNLRQYSPEGTFNAFAKNLDRLKAMGVQTLWFMPINPISKVDRKGAMGSYYAVADYTAVNPEFGSLEDWKKLVTQAHEKGFKIIIDWVPNHTGADHRWLTQHPDFFAKDSAGKPAIPFDWTDTRQLNYTSLEMQDSMIAAMKFWISQTDIDGFRCDVAWHVPASFWNKCNAQLRKMKNIFMLAEGDSSYLPNSGFDAVYPWQMFHMMEKIAKGDRPAFGLDSIKSVSDTAYPRNTIQMYFTSNHDENSWNKADYGSFPGPVHAPFAVFTQTMANSVPLIYSGQEEPFLDSLSFFYKDTISFNKFERAPFYKTLLSLRKNNPALAANASFKKLISTNDTCIYAYLRESDKHKILVLLNLSKSPQHFTLLNAPIDGSPLDIFSGKTEQLNNSSSFSMPAWGYRIYSY